MDRKLTDEEKGLLLSEKIGDEGRTFRAIETFQASEEEPSLYDIVIDEILTKIEAQKEIIIEYAKRVEQLEETVFCLENK